MRVNVTPTGGKKYDACFVCLTELKNDARTLNLARTIARSGRSVCIIATGEPEDVMGFFAEGISFFFVSPSESSRAYQRVLNFNIKAMKYRSRARANTFWAMDLYSLYIAKELSIIHSGKLIYDSREIYSALGSLHQSQLRQSIQNIIEKRLVRYVDRIIVSGIMDAEYLDKHFNAPVGYEVIMNLPPYKKPIGSNYLRKQFNIPEDKRIILYQGMLMKGRGIIPIIKAMSYIPNAVFCLLGSGDYELKLKDEVKSLGIEDRVIFCGRADYDKLHELTCSADVGTSMIEPISLSYKLALPNKLFEYCMAGLPVLASNLPAIKLVFDEFNIGKAINPDSEPEMIAFHLKDLLENKPKYAAECARAALKYNYEAQKDDILKLAEI